MVVVEVDALEAARQRRRKGSNRSGTGGFEGLRGMDAYRRPDRERMVRRGFKVVGNRLIRNQQNECRQEKGDRSIFHVT